MLSCENIILVLLAFVVVVFVVDAFFLGDSLSLFPEVLRGLLGGTSSAVPSFHEIL